MDPNQFADYSAQQTDGNIRIVDRIDDLPPPSEGLMRALNNYNQPNSSHYNAGLSTNIDQLTNVSRSSNTPAHSQERVLSPGYKSSNPSPTMAPFQQSQSEHHTSHDSPIQLKSEDIY